VLCRESPGAIAAKRRRMPTPALCQARAAAKQKWKADLRKFRFLGARTMEPMNCAGRECGALDSCDILRADASQKPIKFR